ncbi:unnamed protein product, partial [Effrenium voratum]
MGPAWQGLLEVSRGPQLRDARRLALQRERLERQALQPEDYLTGSGSELEHEAKDEGERLQPIAEIKRSSAALELPEVPQLQARAKDAARGVQGDEPKVYLKPDDHFGPQEAKKKTSKTLGESASGLNGTYAEGGSGTTGQQRQRPLPQQGHDLEDI